MDRVADKVEASYSKLVETLGTSDVVFADETSWYVGELGWWLWGFTNQESTAYVVDQSRGSQVVPDVLRDDFEGMLVTNCLATYDPIDCRTHKCIAHHLRAIAAARERKILTIACHCKQPRKRPLTRWMQALMILPRKAN